jgi:hypothetical protein
LIFQLSASAFGFGDLRGRLNLSAASINRFLFGVSNAACSGFSIRFRFGVCNGCASAASAQLSRLPMV